MIFKPDRENVRIMGRSEVFEDARYITFSGSSISFTFTGKKAAACIVSDSHTMTDDVAAYIAIYIDNSEYPVKRIKLSEAEKVYTLYEGTEKKEVTVRIEKFSEAANGSCGIKYIEADGVIRPEDTKFEHKIEIIGDSITCAYGVESENEFSPYDTKDENPEKSYSLKTARALNAEVNLVSWSGIGVQSTFVGEDATAPDEYWLMPMLYQYEDANISSRFYGMDKSVWKKHDFTEYEPELILINLGTNDASWSKDIPERHADFRNKYRAFLTYVIENNPKSKVICMLGTMDQRMCNDVEMVTKEKNVPFIHLPMQEFKDGFVCNFHPTEVTHQKTMEFIVPKIKEIMNW